MPTKRTAHTLASLVPLVAVVLLGAAFLVLYEAVVLAEPDFVAIVAFSSSPTGLLLMYLAALAFFFYARPELPWAELE